MAFMCCLAAVPRPPRPALFPYTTLFRSANRPAHPARPALAAVTVHRLDLVSVNGEEDRKSTRLNSSHVSISYAVFCLKKKKQPPHAAAHPPAATEKTPRVPPRRHPPELH